MPSLVRSNKVSQNLPFHAQNCATKQQFLSQLYRDGTRGGNETKGGRARATVPRWETSSQVAEHDLHGYDRGENPALQLAPYWCLNPPTSFD